MRKIAVLDCFMEPKHRQKVTETAEKLGFSVDYFTEDKVPADLAGDYEILYGMPEPKDLKELRNLKWFCTPAAGVDIYMGEDIFPSPQVLLSNSSGAYGITIAEHIIMVLLMLLRRMPEFQQIVRERRWVRSMPIRSICGSTITVVGTGDIGTTFARRAKAFGPAAIRGVRRSKKAADPCFDSIHTTDELDALLPDTDILLLALPSTASTAGILSRQRIALLPPQALVVNVGRGTAVDQDALMEALNSGAIAGAALDVMVPEPLPPEHPLWETRNLLLTPHISGNMSLPITCDIDVDLFCRDLAHYAAGEPLEQLVNRNLGY